MTKRLLNQQQQEGKRMKRLQDVSCDLQNYQHDLRFWYEMVRDEIVDDEMVDDERWDGKLWDKL